MAAKPTATAPPSTLLEVLVERARLPGLLLAILVALASALLLVGAACLDGVLARPFVADFWRVGLIYPTVIAYCLWTVSPSRRLRDGAIQAFRPLVPLDDDDFQRLLIGATLFNRRRQWLALGIGGASTLLLIGTIRGLASAGRLGWPLMLYAVLTEGLMCAVLGLSIYSSLSGSRLFSELSRYPLNINVFELESLEPIARWSLGGALGFIGGVALSLLLLPRTALLRIDVMLMVYTPLTLTAVLTFYLNMKSIHDDMVKAKERELKMVRARLVAASQALRDQAAKGLADEARVALAAIAAWAAHEKLIKGLPEWPYTAAIQRNLLLSLLLPGAVGMAREALFGLLRKSLPLP